MRAHLFEQKVCECKGENETYHHRLHRKCMLLFLFVFFVKVVVFFFTLQVKASVHFLLSLEFIHFIFVETKCHFELIVDLNDRGLSYTNMKRIQKRGHTNHEDFLGLIN